MNRLNFYQVETIEGVPELDYLSNNLSKFSMIYPISYYVVHQDDLLRPDLISYKIYGTVKFWWLIMFINNIENIFSDLELGLTLQIPNVLDIYSFYRKWSVRV